MGLQNKPVFLLPCKRRRWPAFEWRLEVANDALETSWRGS
jgi:hypothetical protein